MKRYFPPMLAIALAVLVSIAFSQSKSTAQQDTATKPALDTLEAKVSYALGLNFGRKLKQDDVAVDASVLARGVQDGMAGSKPLMSDQEMQAAFQEFAQVMQARHKAKDETNKKRGEAFLAENKKRKGVITLKSGLQYEIIKTGSGKSPRLTDRVKTHYHGTLIDGTVFDSSVERNQPITFPVNGVIKGWTEALQLMKVGDKWRLFVPPELAYGERGAPPKIGPNSVLIFEVELLGIE